MSEFVSRYGVLQMSSLDTSFINRERELGFLERIWSRQGFQLLILYGRRRIGKTRLLREFCRGKPCIFYTCVESSPEVLRDEFIEVVRRRLGLSVYGRDFVEALVDLVGKYRGRLVIVLDEFQYLARSIRGLTSILQRAIDEYFINTDLMLVLCGSSISFMERKVLGYQSPLYGRRTNSLHLKQLNPLDIHGFYPEWSLKEVFMAYGVLGGTPAYHKLFDERKSLWDNVYEKILCPGEYLYDEAVNLLRQELRDPHTYLSILSCIAHGYTRVSEIASKIHVDQRSMSKYIRVLEELEIVKRYTPIGRKKPVHIRFRDNYFRFWFTYVKPFQGLLELGEIDHVLEHIRGTWSLYMGHVFRDIVEEIAVFMYRNGLLKTKPLNIGRWWYKDLEIDLIVYDDESISYVEVKWSKLDRYSIRRILNKLREKSRRLGITRRREYYVVVSMEKEESVLEENEYSIDISDLEGCLRKL